MSDQPAPETSPQPTPDLAGTSEPACTKPRAARARARKAAKSGTFSDSNKTRTRSRSLNIRKSRRQMVMHGYKQQQRSRVDGLVAPDEEATGERVLRADSGSLGKRRGREYFRGVGESFSTCRLRKQGPGKEMTVVGRALSSSPERV